MKLFTLAQADTVQWLRQGIPTPVTVADIHKQTKLKPFSR